MLGSAKREGGLRTLLGRAGPRGANSNGASATAPRSRHRPDGARTLVVLVSDLYVRNLLSTGSFRALDERQTFYVGSSKVADLTPLEAQPGFVGCVDVAAPRARIYAELRRFLLFALRRRSRTMRHKLDARGLRLRRWYVDRSFDRGAVKARVRLRLSVDWRRLIYKLAPLPGVKQAAVRGFLLAAGRNSELEDVIRRVRPDVVIAPSAGGEDLVFDAVRGARALGVPSIVPVMNWDNLSSKGAFPVHPDRLGVWGEQSVEHARRIHDIPAKSISVLGVPTFDHYFQYERGSRPSPQPFRYALFAGCFAAFDEETPLRWLDELIERHGLDLEVVYRPHPYRQDRERDDFVDDTTFRHVTLDPQVRDSYVGAYRARSKKIWQSGGPVFPPLDYYAPLLDNAAFVVCPLSTMIVEAAIFERRVIVPAWDDGIHAIPPSAAIEYEHFGGIEDIDGLDICRSREQFESSFLRLASVGGGSRSGPSMRDQIGWWLYHDERTYAERLASLVASTAGKRSIES